MFELFVALKYLIPKKRALSTSLISLMSIFVISLVVWLILIFLSVTAGIEKNWLTKLTALNAPLRITPTEKYYNSHYYQIDKISEKANYSTKTIGEKSKSANVDEYSTEEDIETPYYWPNPDLNPDGTKKDIVKMLYQTLSDSTPALTFHDFEVSGALMRLSLYRSTQNDNLYFKDEKLSFITQMSYLLSHTDNNPNFKELSLPLDTSDLNNLFDRLDKSTDKIQEETPSLIHNDIHENDLNTYFHRFFDNLNIKKMISEKGFQIPLLFFQKNKEYKAFASFNNKGINKIFIDENETPALADYTSGKLLFVEGSGYVFKALDGVTYNIDKSADITAISPIIFNAEIINKSIDTAQNVNDIKFILSGKIQGNPISGTSHHNKLKIYDAKAKTLFESPPKYQPLWVYELKSKSHASEFIIPEQKDQGVILPKSLKDNGILLGDKGYFSYAAKTAIATQEQRIPIFVSGFYDPGILSIGNRCIIVPNEITKTISGVNSAFAPDGIPSNGIFVWFKDLSKVDQIKKQLTENLKKNGIDSYWSIQTYKEYEFAKDLLMQFQSDRLLLILIAIIIIIVACSNIISLLVLLVNDKKKEIAVLQAMGATKKSIALIFGSCGIIMGFLSSLIGTVAAIITLKNINILVSFLSSLQGHDAFNIAFFGEKLPSTLSINSLVFILIITPIISLLAGLIPAIKASKLHPSNILRGS